jgi:hypothetical protein
MPVKRTTDRLSCGSADESADAVGGGVDLGDHDGRSGVGGVDHHAAADGDRGVPAAFQDQDVAGLDLGDRDGPADAEQGRGLVGQPDADPGVRGQDEAGAVERGGPGGAVAVGLAELGAGVGDDLGGAAGRRGLAGRAGLGAFDGLRPGRGFRAVPGGVLAAAGLRGLRGFRRRRGRGGCGRLGQALRVERVGADGRALGPIGADGGDELNAVLEGGSGGGGGRARRRAGGEGRGERGGEGGDDGDRGSGPAGARRSPEQRGLPGSAWGSLASPWPAVRPRRYRGRASGGAFTTWRVRAAGEPRRGEAVSPMVGVAAPTCPAYRKSQLLGEFTRSCWGVGGPAAPITEADAG